MVLLGISDKPLRPVPVFLRWYLEQGMHWNVFNRSGAVAVAALAGMLATSKPSKAFQAAA